MLADRVGYNAASFGGSLGLLVSLELASFSQKYWHGILTHGIFLGVSCSFVYFPACSVLLHWFDKKKGLAVGIAASGSGIGGLVISSLSRLGIASIGIPWTLRVTGLVGGVICLCCSLLLQTRIPPSVTKYDIIALFKERRFILFFLSTLLVSFGYFTPYFFIPLYSLKFGMVASEGALLLGIMNLGSAIGRILTGYIGDRFGFIETSFACLLGASLSTFLIWPFSMTFLALAFYALIYGFCVGGYISLFTPSVSFVFGNEDVATIIGTIAVVLFE